MNPLAVPETHVEVAQAIVVELVAAAIMVPDIGAEAVATVPPAVVAHVPVRDVVVVVAEIVPNVVVATVVAVAIVAAVVTVAAGALVVVVATAIAAGFVVAASAATAALVAVVAGVDVSLKGLVMVLFLQLEWVVFLAVIYHWPARVTPPSMNQKLLVGHSKSSDAEQRTPHQVQTWPTLLRLRW